MSVIDSALTRWLKNIANDRAEALARGEEVPDLLTRMGPKYPFYHFAEGSAEGALHYPHSRKTS